MKKKHIITIAGGPGSGKSTSAKAVAERLGFKHFSSGDLFRELGKERGIELLQANKSAKAHEELDPLVDNKLRQIGATEDNIIIDSRTAWHWIPSSYKVFLDLDLRIAAQRILNESIESRLSNEYVHQDPEEYGHLLKQRQEGETKRYLEKYGINPYDLSNYDLVIDTSSNNISEVVEKVVKGFNKWIGDY